jgi:cvfA/B/C family virulence factor
MNGEDKRPATKFQVMYWKHIPSQVKAWDGEAEVKRMLPDYFQAAIDAYAMKDGSTDMDAYLEGWRWGEIQERDGTPTEVVEVVIKELTAANPRSRLLDQS